MSLNKGKNIFNGYQRMQKMTFVSHVLAYAEVKSSMQVDSIESQSIVVKDKQNYIIILIILMLCM